MRYGKGDRSVCGGEGPKHPLFLWHDCGACCVQAVELLKLVDLWVYGFGAEALQAWAEKGISQG